MKNLLIAADVVAETASQPLFAAIVSTTNFREFFKLRSKFILSMFCLSVVSGLANANNYFENIYIGDGTSTNSNTFNSTTPSPGNVVLSGIYTNCDTGFCTTTSLLRAEISADPLPFVRTSSQTVNFQLDDRGAIGSTIAQASIQYDINLTGTPNSYVPVNMFSLLSANIDESSLFSGAAFANLVFSNSVNFLSYGLEVRGGITQPTNLNLQQFQTFSSFGAPSAITTLNGIEITPQGLVLSESDRRFSVDQTLESQLYFFLNDEGFSTGTITLSSQVSTVAANGFSYIDPFFSINPDFLALNPNTSLSFTPGVGNANPLSSVPVPAALPLMASALGLFGFGAIRRKASKA